jgi:hypothetical protein
VVRLALSRARQGYHRPAGLRKGCFFEFLEFNVRLNKIK